MKAFQPRPARIVDARHIVPDTILVAYTLADTPKDAISGRKFFIDPLLVWPPALDLASEASPVGVDCLRHAKGADQGHKEADFILCGDPVAEFVFRTFAEAPDERMH